MTLTSPRYELWDRRALPQRWPYQTQEVGLHVRGKGNAKHLACGVSTKEHLAKRRFHSGPKGRVNHEDGVRGRTVPGASDEARGAETKS